MEIKLNIETSQLGDTVVDLFKNLSDEKKEELASEVIKQYLDDKVRQQIGWNDYLLTNITKKIDTYFIDEIKNNEDFIKSKDEAIKVVSEKMPEIVVNAMSAAFASNLMTMQNQIFTAFNQSLMNETQMKDMRQRLGMGYQY
jgi:SOS response regulatory protein OraA/RecX